MASELSKKLASIRPTWNVFYPTLSNHTRERRRQGRTRDMKVMRKLGRPNYTPPSVNMPYVKEK